MSPFSFCLPAKTTHALILRRWPWILAVGVGLAVVVVRGPTMTGVDGAVLLLGAGFLYLYALNFRWVTVGMQGLSGSFRPMGPRPRLGWSEPVVVRSVTTLGLPCIEVLARDQSRSIRIPLEIARSQRFQQAVAEWAPQHVLLKVSRHGL